MWSLSGSLKEGISLALKDRLPRISTPLYRLAPGVTGPGGFVLPLQASAWDSNMHWGVGAVTDEAAGG